MVRAKKSKTTLFLMELILVILIFSIASAICMQLFAKSSTLTRDSNRLDNSATISSNIFEIIKSNNGDLDILKKEYQLYDDNIIYFDDDFDNCNKENAVYKMIITTSSVKHLNTYNLNIVKGKDKIYSTEYKLAIKY